jgi:hypothetical protein
MKGVWSWNSISGQKKETAGPSTTLRSGRDDNSLGLREGSATELSSRPERSVVEGPAVLLTGSKALSFGVFGFDGDLHVRRYFAMQLDRHVELAQLA